MPLKPNKKSKAQIGTSNTPGNNFLRSLYFITKIALFGAGIIKIMKNDNAKNWSNSVLYIDCDGADSFHA